MIVPGSGGKEGQVRWPRRARKAVGNLLDRSRKNKVEGMCFAAWVLASKTSSKVRNAREMLDWNRIRHALLGWAAGAAYMARVDNWARRRARQWMIRSAAKRPP